MTAEPLIAEHSTVEPAPLLRIREIVKDFPGLRALDSVSMDLHSGEVVAVVGHNGSGKSTLVKVLAGLYTADSGSVVLSSRDGEEAELHIIHQDLGLVSELNAIENLGITRYKGGASIAPFNKRQERARALDLISRFGEQFDVDVPVKSLTPAQRAIIAIARALEGWAHSRNVLILDEPTEALHASEVRILFDAVKRVAGDGAGVIFISHRLDEVLDMADRVVVLRDGRKTADVPREALDHDQLVAHVTGVSVGAEVFSTSDREKGETVLSLVGLKGAGVESVDLTLHKGEVLGVAGVLGSGREALPAMIFGAMEGSADEYVLAGKPYMKRCPAESIRRGMAFVPGDRARFGAVRAMSSRENITLPELRSLRNRFGNLQRKKERIETGALIEKYDVRPPRLEQKFSQFSGGNQQKIVFAKWLRNRPTVILLEEPTQGVDIGAKQAIYSAIEAAAAEGAAVLVCSSDAKELARLCDRVIVLRNGRVTAEVTGDRLTETQLILEGYGLASAATTGTAVIAGSPGEENEGKQ